MSSGAKSGGGGAKVQRRHPGPGATDEEAHAVEPPLEILRATVDERQRTAGPGAARALLLEHSLVDHELLDRGVQDPCQWTACDDFLDERARRVSHEAAARLEPHGEHEGPRAGTGELRNATGNVGDDALVDEEARERVEATRNGEGSRLAPGHQGARSRSEEKAELLELFLGFVVGLHGAHPGRLEAERPCARKGVLLGREVVWMAAGGRLERDVAHIESPWSEAAPRPRLDLPFGDVHAHGRLHPNCRLEPSAPVGDEVEPEARLEQRAAVVERHRADLEALLDHLLPLLTECRSTATPGMDQSHRSDDPRCTDIAGNRASRGRTRARRRLYSSPKG
jgi:hypothetical protein